MTEPPSDHNAAGIRGQDRRRDHDHSPLQEHIKSRSTWLRLFFMLVLVASVVVAEAVAVAVIVVQFFFVLFTGESNPKLTRFGQSLATYTYQVVRYLTFNTEERPFPFDLDWPPAESNGRGERGHGA